MLTIKQLPDTVPIVKQVMIDCGRMLKQRHGNTDFIEKTSTFDVLTESDVYVENRLKEALANAYPDIPFVGEETGGDYTAKEFWLVDPIDGTIHFTRGLPFSMIMLSLIQEAKPVVGMLYNFMTNEFFSACAGGGAWLNEKPIRVSMREPKSALLLTEMNLDINDNANALQQLSHNFKVLDTCSAGYEFSLVARGIVEARVTKDPYGKAYDFAAGVCIVQEAGGVVRELNGGDFTIHSRDFIAASSEDVMDEIVSVIRKS